jgi:hypothetical protein
MSDTSDPFLHFTDEELGALASAIDALAPHDVDDLAMQRPDADVHGLVATAGLPLDARPWAEVLAELARQALGPFTLGELIAPPEQDPLFYRRILIRSFAGGGPATGPAADLLEVAVAAAAGRVPIADLQRAVETVCEADMGAAALIVDEVAPEIDTAIEMSRRPNDEKARLQALRSQFRRFQDTVARRLDELVAGIAPSLPVVRVLGRGGPEHIGVLRLSTEASGPHALPDELLDALGENARVDLSLGPNELTADVRGVAANFAGALYVAAETSSGDRDLIVATREGDALRAVLAWPSRDLPDALVLGTIEP